MKTKVLAVCLLLSSTLSVFSQENEVNTLVVEANQEAEIAYNQGITFMDTKQYQDAITQFEKALQYNNEFRQAYVNLGSAKSAMQDYDGAIAAFGKALALDSTQGQVWYSKGVALYNKNMYKTLKR